MTKGADAFRSIGEVARLLGVAPHVLRYWETQFPMLRPMKRADGRRYYRPEDVRLAAGLCTVLRDEGLTIRGARKLLARDRGAAVRERGVARLATILEPPADGIDLTEDMDFVEDEAEADPPHEPRSRLRRRHGISPDRPNGAAAGWLGDMVALNARLRAVDPVPPLSRDDRAALVRLRDALARMC